MTDREGWLEGHSSKGDESLDLESAVAPDDAVREVTPAGREQDARRDLRAEVIAETVAETIVTLTAARDAALAGERAAREALARVEALCDQPAPDGWVRYRVLVSDLRAALSPTDQDQPAPVLAPPDTAEQEPQIPPHEHFYLIGERRCGFTVDAGRCQHTAEQEPAPDSEGATTEVGVVYLDAEGKLLVREQNPEHPWCWHRALFYEYGPTWESGYADDFAIRPLRRIWPVSAEEATR